MVVAFGMRKYSCVFSPTGTTIKLQAFRRGRAWYVKPSSRESMEPQRILVTSCARPVVVLLKSGPHEGQIAVIAEIIDHNRVCIGSLESVLTS